MIVCEHRGKCFEAGQVVLVPITIYDTAWHEHAHRRRVLSQPPLDVWEQRGLTDDLHVKVGWPELHMAALHDEWVSPDGER